MPSPALHRELIIWGQNALKPDLFEFRADRGIYEDAGTDPAEDTDPVYQWNDQGPSSRFATQATLANRPTLSSAAVPNYLAFDGTDDNMSFGGSAVMVNSGSPWSVEAWINITDFAAAFRTIFELTSNTTHPFSAGISNNATYLGLHFGSSTTWSRLKTSTSAASWLGADRHIVITYSGAGAGTDANFAAYIDGVQQTLTAAGAFGASANSPSYLGSNVSAGNPLKGRIYKVAGFRRALTQSQVYARFALGVHG